MLSTLHQRIARSIIIGKHRRVHFRSLGTDSNGPERISRTLYRQLLRWCDDTDDAIPLSSLVPPINLESPRAVDAYFCELLSQVPGKLDDQEVARARSLLPPHSILKRNRLVVPVHDSKHLQNFVRLVFRMNSMMPSDEEYQKERISAAFEAIKSLNELSGRVDDLLLRRKSRSERRNVLYSVGEVVQHRQERWRGVVFGWHRPVEDATETHTSLTTKDYTDDSDHIRYDIIIDAGDGYMMGASGDWTTALQSQLDPISDDSLMRIRSAPEGLETHFDSFDPVAKRFCPNGLLQFTYPSDKISKTNALTRQKEQLCNDTISGLKSLASRLERCILDESSCPSERGWILLANVHDRLKRMINDENMVPLSMQLRPSAVTPANHAALYARDLLNLCVEISDVLLQRGIRQKSTTQMKFKVGQIVTHKKYDFRGVVVATDPTPTVDVTRWDGLQDIENPMSLPFYHVVPDQSDCIKAFGGERPLRYVCEENLVHCPDSRSNIDVHIDGGWRREPGSGSFTAPSDVRFKFGEEMDDEGATERALNRMEDEINSWQLLAQRRDSENSYVRHVSLERLHHLLKVVDSLGDAIPIQDLVKDIRKATQKKGLRQLLETGIIALTSGKAQEALDIFQSVVEQDSSYVEGWNKMATCQFMLGQYDKSLISTKKVIDLDPLHFQALNGLGLIHFEKGNYTESVDCFRRSLEIDPWSPVGTKLSMALDLVEKQNRESLQ